MECSPDRHLYADLHMHSTLSDGVLTPEDIIDQATRSELSAIAITDHDAISYSDELANYARSKGITLHCGTEISTKVDGRDIHLLGYFIAQSEMLDELFSRNIQLRQDRALEVADKLCAGGYPIASDELLQTGHVINRSLIARILVDKGIAKNTDDAFRTILYSGGPYYVEAEYVNTHEAIEAVVQAGGVPFIAHPALYRVVDLIPDLKASGLAGIEVYHSLQSHDESAQLRLLADELGLGVSGGSDWHGNDTHGAFLGCAGLDRSEYKDFLSACGQK